MTVTDCLPLGGGGGGAGGREAMKYENVGMPVMEN